MPAARPGARFALDVLTLMPTWHCDIACAHCLFSSSPKVSGQLDLDTARSAIAQVARDTLAGRVVVSGGEPFSDFPYLLAIAEATSREGLKLGVVTNGSFAADEGAARSQLAALWRAGLRGLTVSWDAFHEAFVEPRTIRTLLRLCRELGITPLISAIATRRHGLGDALAALGGDAFEVPAIQFKCLPVGRAGRRVPPEDLLPPAESDRARPCRADFGSLAVTHDGSAYPCSAVGGYTAGLRLGSLHEESLAALLRRRDFEPRWMLLANRGPRAFLDHATAPELQALGVTAADHDCVACHRLFSSPLAATLVERARAALHCQVDERFDLGATGLVQA